MSMLRMKYSHCANHAFITDKPQKSPILDQSCDHFATFSRYESYVNDDFRIDKLLLSLSVGCCFEYFPANNQHIHIPNIHGFDQITTVMRTERAAIHVKVVWASLAPCQHKTGKGGLNVVCTFFYWEAWKSLRLFVLPPCFVIM